MSFLIQIFTNLIPLVDFLNRIYLFIFHRRRWGLGKWTQIPFHWNKYWAHFIFIPSSNIYSTDVFRRVLHYFQITHKGSFWTSWLPVPRHHSYQTSTPANKQVGISTVISTTLWAISRDIITTLTWHHHPYRVTSSPRSRDNITPLTWRHRPFHVTSWLELISLLCINLSWRGCHLTYPWLFPILTEESMIFVMLWRHGWYLSIGLFTLQLRVGARNDWRQNVARHKGMVWRGRSFRLHLEINGKLAGWYLII